jgi:hypothetical protein
MCLLILSLFSAGAWPALADAGIMHCSGASTARVLCTYSDLLLFLLTGCVEVWPPFRRAAFHCCTHLPGGCICSTSGQQEELCPPGVFHHILLCRPAHRVPFSSAQWLTSPAHGLFQQAMYYSRVRSVYCRHSLPSIIMLADVLFRMHVQHAH